MPTSNPYECSAGVESAVEKEKGARTTRRWWIGFAVGALPPLVFGMYGYYDFRLHVASLPPGSSVCGNPAIESIFLIVVGAPVFGLIFASISRLFP